MTMAKQTQTVAPTFNLETLKALVDIPEARAMLASILRETRQEADKADTADAMDKLCIRAFTKAGYKPETVRPRETVKTYNLWLKEGRRVKEGEKSIRVKNLRLFHLDQTEAMTKAETKAALAELEEKRAKRTADKLPPVSPVTAAKPAKAAKGAPVQPAA
jgi:hypothetical protein